MMAQLTNYVYQQHVRVGNLINSESTGKPVVVTAGVLVDLPSEGASSYTGIPLTDEWLRTFYFEQNMQGSTSARYNYMVGYWQRADVTLYVGLEEEEKEFYYYVPHYYSDSMLAQGKPVRYVHQLQNLGFALFSEELTRRSLIV